MAPQEYTSSRDGAGLRIAIVAARFNEMITRRLYAGALDALIDHGVADDNVRVVWVPGAFEIPTAAMQLAQSGHFDAVVCLGAVIRGETSHFDYVSMGVTQGVSRVALDTGVPTLFGVLTTDTIEQALARSGAKTANRGYDAAIAAIEMVRLKNNIPTSRRVRRDTPPPGQPAS